MADEVDLAQRISGETPWWAKAPVWLAAGIVGIPSLIALGAGYYIVQGVQRQLATLVTYNLSEIHMLNEQNNTLNARWEAMRRLLSVNTQILIKNCQHGAQTQQERDDCLQALADGK